MRATWTGDVAARKSDGRANISARNYYTNLSIFDQKRGFIKHNIHLNRFYILNHAFTVLISSEYAILVRAVCRTCFSEQVRWNLYLSSTAQVKKQVAPQCTCFRNSEGTSCAKSIAVLVFKSEYCAPWRFRGSVASRLRRASVTLYLPGTSASWSTFSSPGNLWRVRRVRLGSYLGDEQLPTAVALQCGPPP